MDSLLTRLMPEANSTMALEIDQLYEFILYWSLFFLAIVTFFSVYFAIKYRRKGEPGLTYGKDHNLFLEILWTGFPTVLVIIVFIWSFTDFIKMYTMPYDPMEVNVTAQMWAWNFDYPEGVNTFRDMVVPVNRNVKLVMSSEDVIHSFFVPQFRVKADVLPNQYTVIWFNANKTGTYPIFCTEFCGKGHSEMLGSVRVVTKEIYAVWLDARSDPGKGLTPLEFGEKLYNQKACFTCHSTDGSENVGPTFKGIWDSTEKLLNGQTVKVDENYIRESILTPNKKIVLGFDKTAMPTYQGKIKDKEILALIAYIKSLK